MAASNSWSRGKSSSGWGPSSTDRAPKATNEGVTKSSSSGTSWKPSIAGYGGAASSSKLSSSPLKPTKFNDLKKVKIEGLALLKIIKSATHSLPETCSGTLLGLDNNSTLEVTNCFAHPDDPTSKSSSEASSAASSHYQMKMMSLLRDCYVDNCCVGWYKSTNLSTFCTSSLLEEQYNYQTELDHLNSARSVVIIFDPFLCAQGTLHLKAYRIDQNFMTNYKENPKDASDEISNTKTEGQVFVEVPIEITNSVHVKLYLKQLSDKLDLGSVSDSSMILGSQGVLEKYLERLIDEGDRLDAEETKAHHYERQTARQKQQQQQWLEQRRAENKIRVERGAKPLPETDPTNPIFKQLNPPNKVESVLARTQLGEYCNSLNAYSAQAVPKLFVTTSMQNQ